MSLIEDAIEVQYQSTAALSAKDDTVTLTESELKTLHALWHKQFIAEYEALKLDAARYRWLYKNCDSDSPSPDCRMMDGSDLEYLIDKALAQLGERHE